MTNPAASQSSIIRGRAATHRLRRSTPAVSRSMVLVGSSLIFNGVIVASVLLGHLSKALLVVPALYGALLIIFFPVLGVCVLMASVPLAEHLPRLPLVTSGTVAAGAVTAFALAIHLFLGRLPLVRLPSSVFKWALVFYTIVVVGLIFGKAPFYSGALTYLQLLLLMLVVSQILRTLAAVEWVMLAWVAVIAFIQIGGLMHFDFMTVGRENRLEGLIANANLLSYHSLVSLWFAIYFVFSSRRRWLRFAALCAMGLDIVSILLSVSRAGIVALAATGLIGILLFREHIGRRGIFIAVVVAALMVWLPQHVQMSKVQREIENIPTLIQAENPDQNSYGERVWFWRLWLEQWAMSPLLGIGAMGTQGGQVLAIDVAHNSYISILVETGLLGLSALCALLISSIKGYLSARATFLRNRTRDPASFWLLALAAWAIMSLANSFEYDKLFWVMLAMAPALVRISARGSEPGIA